MLAIHIFSAVFSFVTVFVADKDALAWVRGRKRVLSVKRLRVMHILTWGGLLALIISGAFLALPLFTYLLSQPLFQMKLLFVAVLVVNAFIIDRYSNVATIRTFASLSKDERYPLFTSGAISATSWVGALVLALVIFK